MFRSDIEGLRGVAVLLIVAFHVATPGFRGGFVGVDVFFILSGERVTDQNIRRIFSSILQKRVQFASNLQTCSWEWSASLSP
jgi:peptidoglycan/LPS O-acetylase OafA/YrhL